MTVPVQNTVVSYTANGATTVFPYTFKITDADDLDITLDGVLASSGFSVSGVGEETGGNVTFSTAPANGVKIVIVLNPSLERLTDYQQFGDLLAPVLNDDIDRLWLALQSISQNYKRALKLPIDTTTDQVIAESAAARAGKLVSFDGSGNMILSVLADASLAVISTFAATLLDDADAAAMRTTLGLPSVFQTQAYTAFTTAGTAPSFTLTPSPAIGAYAAGQRFRVKFHANGAGSDTLNVSGLGAKSLKQYDPAGAKIAATVKANMLADVEYDGTDLLVLDPLLAIPADFVTPAMLTQKITSAAAQTASNNTSFDFTGIPSWAKVIHISLSGISTNGATSPQIQLGTSGGFETSGYLGAVDVGGTAANFSSGFSVGRGWSATVVAHGGFTLSLIDATTNTWAIFGIIGGSHAAVVSGVGGGSKALAGTLDRLRLYIDGTQQFDAGKINITYE